MNNEKIIAKLRTLKGQIITLEARKKLKTRKGVSALVEKQTVFQARIGVSYDNITRVKEGRENGTLPEENQGLPYGTWTIFPIEIEHKGELYLRCSKVLNKFKKRETFFLDGKEVGRESLRALVLASEIEEKETPEVFNYKESHIVAMH
jgi:hypothetical protein